MAKATCLTGGGKDMRLQHDTAASRMFDVDFLIWVFIT